MGIAFRSHARALEGSRRDALTDTLTGLGNRRKLLEDLEDVLANAAETRLLVVLDLDCFKAYNDVFGHPAGDALLARLGRRIEAALPPRARAYRLGGDEFCALVDDRGSDCDAVLAAVSRSLSESGDGVSPIAPTAAPAPAGRRSRSCAAARAASSTPSWWQPSASSWTRRSSRACTPRSSASSNTYRRGRISGR